MSSIYIHIPFCKQACIYCDFHFSTQTNYVDDFVKALVQEIHLRKDYLQNRNIETVYFGGGTPSIISSDHLFRIIEALHHVYKISSTAEITLEANPDDVTEQKLRDWIAVGVNRLSIGTQSFDENDLQLLHRAHNASQAEYCIKQAQDKGITNISIDLIYGLPNSTLQTWDANLRKFIAFQIPHLSAYCLTVEPKTVLAHRVKNNLTQLPTDEKAAAQFIHLLDFCEHNNIIQYEISNFCRPGFISKHNSNYWKNKEYIGLGPSAHSYSGTSRQWNVSNNHLYIKSVVLGKLDFEKEKLAKNDLFNEYVMTSLRTMWGVDRNYIVSQFGNEYESHFAEGIAPFVEGKNVLVKENNYTLTRTGKLIADKIASDLFFTKHENGKYNQV
ncbi:MAG: radical SAM family heme chaperone HemW [Bacteroidetes bacterium]|nr:radical SAM family heme chaperone HemW [Bacteroidota bacterium]